MRHRTRISRDHLVIGLVAFSLFIPFLGSVRLFDWDEINFAECAREMIVTGDYMHVQIDYQPFYEKPPLFIWAQVLSMKVFGVNEFAARLPNAIVGIITLLIIFSLGERLFDKRFGYLWVLAYAGSLLPNFYFHSGIIDPLFNLFIFLGVLSMIKVLQGAGARNAMLAGLWGACAVMTKGPVGFGLILITIVVSWFFLRSRTTTQPHTPAPLRPTTPHYATLLTLFCLVCFAFSSLWFLIDLLQNGPGFVTENVQYQWRLLTTGEAGHEQPFYYHPIVVLFGCFPASFIMLGAWKRDTTESDQQRVMRIVMVVLMFVVLIVFSLVKTKIIHYSSMTYLPLSYLAALNVHRWLRGTMNWHWWRTTSIAIFGFSISGFFAFSLVAVQQREWLLSLPTFRDVFLRSSIQQDVAWSGFEPFISVILVTGIVVFVVLKRNGKHLRSIVVLFASVAFFASSLLIAVAPRIESYTQGAALNLYESLVGKDVYVKPLTMKSYAHLFYTQKPYELSAAAKGVPPDAWEPWLLGAAIDKPAYFVCKINDAAPWRVNGQLREIREHGGFVFFERVIE